MSVSNSNHKFTAIENGTNFRDWDKQSYAIAMAAGCEWVIDTDYPRVPRTIRNHAGEPFTEPMDNLMSFQDKWRAASKKLYTMVLSAAKPGSDAMAIVQGAPEGCGASAYLLLRANYKRKDTSTAVGLIMKLIKLRQTGPVRVFINRWKQEIRNLADQGLDLPEPIIAAFFLISLHRRFTPFVTQQLMLSAINLEEMYQAAIKFEQTQGIRTGEADNGEVALYGNDDDNDDNNTGGATGGTTRNNNNNRRFKGKCLHCGGPHSVLDWVVWASARK